MGSSTDGSPAAQGALDGMTDEPGPDQGQRGFFGRLLSAFSPASELADTRGRLRRQLLRRRGLHALRRMRVDDVAIPKAEIVAVPLDIGKDDLVEPSSASMASAACRSTRARWTIRRGWCC